MKKITEQTAKLITKDVLTKLNINGKIKENDIDALTEYFCDLEVYYANGEDENYYGISKERLEEICHAADEFNTRQNEEIDIEDLNRKLNLK